MTRRSLSDLIDSPSDPQPDAPRSTAAAARPQPGPRPEQPKRRPQERPANPVENSGTPEVPKYKTLERKEVLARPDQLTELTALRRRLNRARQGDGERITENTLIRVAVDLLLANSGNLTGVTEDELRDSLTSAVRAGKQDGR